MTSTRLAAKLPAQKRTIKKDRTETSPATADALALDEISIIEEAHAALLDAQVFVGISSELEQDEKWRGRLTVLLPPANASVERAIAAVERALSVFMRRRRKEKPSAG